MARKLELPSDMEETGLSREFLKIALYIFKKFKFKDRFSSGEKVRGYLRTLGNRKNVEKAETEYYIRKIGIVLIMAVAGSILSALMYLSNMMGTDVNKTQKLIRKDYGEGEFTAKLIASDTEGNEIGDAEILVGERLYTESEADEMFDEACEALLNTVLGDNESFDHVTNNLNLVDKLEGYPFLIDWHIDNYEVIHFDGRLEEDNIPKEGTIVNLTADFKYNGKIWEQQLPVRLFRRDMTPDEKIRSELKKLLKKAEENSVNSEYVELPQSYNDEAITWKEKIEDNSLVILVITLIGGAASYVLKDKELKKGIENREVQMLNDYPQLVSQLVLYLGAGMTMRNIFEKLARDYMKKSSTGAGKRYVYEEIQVAVRELSSGVSEALVYENFGLRCQNRQYTRLGTLLSQNLRKGNSEMLTILQEESQKAFEEKMDRVRKLGEEAGTKLLLPMIMMLVIVMVIIMIPAYLSF
ncbi:MAG: type II secretion system F family protein [Butyrivibrio sp.]|nr:type II secretion system F family protein [Butyrivibrio sp.]